MARGVRTTRAMAAAAPTTTTTGAMMAGHPSRRSRGPKAFRRSIPSCGISSGGARDCWSACRALADAAGAGAGAADASEVVDELKKLKEEKLERAGKYRAKVAGTETPEWTGARVVASRELLPKLREVVLEVETSRELVSLRNSYCAAGKLAQLKVKGSDALALTPASAPFAPEAQHGPLLKLRGDLTAGQTKLPEDPIEVKQRLSVLVTPDDGDHIYTLSPDTSGVEVGPFLGAGLNLRKIRSVYNYPTVILLAEGQGIGTAKALIEGGMDVRYRESVTLFYKVPHQESVAFAEEQQQWLDQYGVRTVVHTESFLDAFDDDALLEYHPEATAVISLGGEEAERGAEELCQDAEIGTHIRASEEMQEMHYADTGRVV